MLCGVYWYMRHVSWEMPQFRCLVTILCLALPAISQTAPEPEVTMAFSSQSVKSEASAPQTPELPQWQKTAGGGLSFEVASIRPTKPGEFTPPSFGLSSQDRSEPVGGLFVADFPLIIYIDFAYKLRPSASEETSLLSTLPKWVASESYEIRARGAGNPDKDQMRVMMQSLLADRFKLAAHFEAKIVPVLALTLVKPNKTGDRLRPHPDGLACYVRDEPFPPVCGVSTEISKPDHVYLMGSRDITLSSLAASLGGYSGLDRPVVDKTGLRGRYDYAIEWMEEPRSGADAEPAFQGTTFLEALRDQLGLKLERSMAPVEVLVIDHVERPSAN
jgi:bla regulator protein BlaR1